MIQLGVAKDRESLLHATLKKICCPVPPRAQVFTLSEASVRPGVTRRFGEYLVREALIPFPDNGPVLGSAQAGFEPSVAR